MGSRVEQSEIAVIYDYDSWWAYENGLLTKLFDYRAEFFHWYRAILDAGVTADIVGKNDCWENYKTVMFPVTYLVDSDVSKRAERYVNGGGCLVVTYGAGISDPCDHVYTGGYPGAFRDILGVRVEEFSAIDKDHTISLSNGWSGSIWADDISEIAGEHECATPSVLGYFPGRVRIALHERYEAGRCKGGVFNRCAFRAYMAEVMPHAAASFHKLHLLFVDAYNPSIRIGVPVQADYKAV